MKKVSSIYLTWVLMLLANVVLLGGCMKKLDNRNNGQKLEISREETLRLNFTDGDIPSLDPQELALSARGLALGKWLFEGLTRLNLEGEYELAGAKKVDISSCKKRYLFTLRPNYYSDGTIILAQDYENAWKRAIAPGSKCGKSHLFYYIKNAREAKQGQASIDDVGVKALSENTLLVELTGPTPYFLTLLASPLFAAFKVEGKEIVFNGPYKVTQWERESCLSLERNPFFWDKENIKIKKIEVLSIKDDETTLYLGESGTIDWIGPPFADLSSDVMNIKISQGDFLERPNIRPLWIFLNTSIPFLSSRPIREALSIVIDRQSIAKHIFSQCAPLFTPLPKQISLSLNNLSDCDLEKGKELFEKGLEEIGESRDTLPVITLACCRHVDSKKLFEYLKETWEEAFGIRMSLEVQEWNTYFKHLQQKKYDIGGMFFGSDYNDPLSCLEQMAYDNNYSGWDNKPYRQAIKQAKEEANLSLRKEMLRKAEEILQTEVPIIPIVNEMLYCFYRQDLKGVCFDHRGTPDLRWAYLETKQNENLQPLESR